MECRDLRSQIVPVLTRRAFLKQGGVAVSLVSLGPVISAAAAQQTSVTAARRRTHEALTEALARSSNLGPFTPTQGRARSLFDDRYAHAHGAQREALDAALDAVASLDRGRFVDRPPAERLRLIRQARREDRCSCPRNGTRAPEQHGPRPPLAHFVDNAIALALPTSPAVGSPLGLIGITI